MSELTNYSIETDQTVLLHFTDGKRRRVAFDQLHEHLKPDDLQRVTAAIKLRRNFIRNHMPKTLALFAAVGLGALFITTEQTVASMIAHHPTATVPDQAGLLTRVTPTPSPSAASASPAPSVSPVSGAVAGAASSPTPISTPSPTPGPAKSLLVPVVKPAPTSVPPASSLIKPLKSLLGL
jgi:hypothetical protein